MLVIGIEGSPRKQGNTEQLVATVLDGAKEAGAETNFFKLADMDIADCISCYGCKKKGICVVEDDMHILYEAIQQADAVVLGSPVYFWQVNAITKRFMDRLLAFIAPDFSTRLNGSKKLLFAYTQGNPEEGKFQPYFEHMEKLFSFLHYDVQGTLVANGTRQLNDILSNEKILTKARKTGIELVS
jgi:multimeric flavodoxin WrbA